MRKDRLMNKSVKQAEKETGASPYKKGVVNTRLRWNLQVAVLWKAVLQPISMKNIGLHKNKF